MVVKLLDDDSPFSIKKSGETCHHQPRKKLYHTCYMDPVLFSCKIIACISSLRGMAGVDPESRVDEA